MARQRSLSGARVFRRVQVEGRRARRDGITVFAAPAPDGTGVRLGLSVGRRVGRATTRNLIKRRLRAAFASARVGGDVDVVIRAGESVASKSFQEIEAYVHGALGRVTAGRP